MHTTPHHTTPHHTTHYDCPVTPSTLIRKVLNLSSALIQAAFDLIIHQAILSAVLALSSVTLETGYDVFLSGIIPLCYAFMSLYGVGILYHEFREEKRRLSRAWALCIILTLLFSFTSEQTIPFFPVMMSMLVFMAVNFVFRYSLRHVLASKKSEAFTMFSATPACASEATPPETPDTSLRKDYRHNMKAVLAKKSRVYFFIKRAFDVLSSGFALVVLSPLLLVTAIAIKLEDGGPVIYGADRWGKDLQTFRMYKFRSMIPDAESRIKDLLKDSEMTGHAFKIKDDPRITRVGRFIRKYSIDELPQLWNIFKGDMSVVGPRAIMTVGTDSIDDYDKQRWLVRPGLTCYWQVSGRAGIKWEQWIEMDLDYIENMSVWEDVKLILKTFPVVFKADGAY